MLVFVVVMGRERGRSRWGAGRDGEEGERKEGVEEGGRRRGRREAVDVLEQFINNFSRPPFCHDLKKKKKNTRKMLKHRKNT